MKDITQLEGFQDFVKAVSQVAAGNPVEDLEGILDPISKAEAPFQGFFDLARTMWAVKKENRVLQGEHPQDVYGGARYMQTAQKFLRQFLGKYEQ